MLTWQLVLRTRKQVCENRLWAAYANYGDVILERRRCPEAGPSWHKKNDRLAVILREIREQMEEIRFIRTLLRMAPLGGLTVVLATEDRPPYAGPTIRELVERYVEKEKGWANLSKDYTQTKRDHEQKAEGLALALEIMTTPYKYLSEEERAGFDLAEGNSNEIVKSRAPSSNAIEPAGKSGPSLSQVKAQATTVTRRK